MAIEFDTNTVIDQYFLTWDIEQLNFVIEGCNTFRFWYQPKQKEA